MAPRQVVENYWQIEETRDVSAILQCYDEEATLVVPNLGRLKGHAEIRRFYQASVDRFPFLAVEVVGAVEDGDRGAFEWRATFRDAAGATYNCEGVNVIRTTGDRLGEVHVYFDPAKLDAPEESKR